MSKFTQGDLLTVATQFSNNLLWDLAWEDSKAYELLATIPNVRLPKQIPFLTLGERHVNEDLWDEMPDYILVLASYTTSCGTASLMHVLEVYLPNTDCDEINIDVSYVAEFKGSRLKNKCLLFKDVFDRV